MNYEISEMMPEYFDEFERLLFQLPIFGSAFKKVYFDASSSRPTSEFVSVDQFYVPFNSPDLQRADRYTHVIYRSANDLKRDMAADMYRDCALSEPANQERSDMSAKMDEILGFSYDSSSDPQYCLLEQHCYLELEGEFETPVTPRMLSPLMKIQARFFQLEGIGKKVILSTLGWNILYITNLCWIRLLWFWLYTFLR